MAVKDVFGQSQNYEELLVEYGLTDAEIIEATRKFWGVKHENHESSCKIRYC